MIISHKHQYVFIEFPQTGCSAIATELICQYDGERILYKHALYSDFLNIEKSRPLRRFIENKKEGKLFSKYCESLTTRNRAIRVITPYMKEWGYDFNFNAKDTSAK